MVDLTLMGRWQVAQWGEAIASSKIVWQRWLFGVWLSGLGLLPATPALSAERIIVNLGILSDSIQVSSLENYAETGEIAPDLYDFLRFVPVEQREAVRAALKAKADLGVIPIAQFLYSPQGEVLLNRLGQVIQSEAQQPGFYGIRAALILAAADPEGVTLLNVLKKFPTPGIRISLGRSLEISRELGGLVEQSQAAIAAVQKQAQVEAAAAPPIDWNLQPDLRLLGPYTWTVQSLELQDPSRDRRFPVDLYRPQTVDGNTRFPVVVISHGLGSDRTSFVYLAQHLASYGFAVAVPEHPGSNAAQIDALLKGRSTEVSEPKEFINRPLDITYLLNALGENPALKSNLDLNNVGVVGQSFGGYTALALGGARINLEKLQRDCANLDRSWDVSLALQCRVPIVATGQEQLQDPRVKAVMAINPVTGSVFGAEGLKSVKIPTLVMASDSDTVAPALLEQLRPFKGLEGPDRYLALMIGGTHFSTIAEGEIPLPPTITGPDLPVAQRYVKALSLAFFRTYLENQPGAAFYLSSSYADAIEQGRLGLVLVQKVPEKLR